MLVSLFPSVGLVFALGLYVTAFATNNDGLKRSCLILFAILGLLALPTYVSGHYSMAVLSGDAKISKDLMNAHFGWGAVALAVVVLTGLAAVIELARSWRLERPSSGALY